MATVIAALPLIRSPVGLSPGVSLCVIMLRDNLNETLLEIWRHCDRG